MCSLGRIPVSPTRTRPLPLFVAAVVASVALEPKGHLDYALQNQLWWQAAGFFLVVAAGVQGILRRALENRAAVFVGAASYSIYLVHDPGMAWYGYSGGANPLLAVVVGVLSGIAFWYFVERNVASGQGRDRLLAATRGVLRPMTGSLRTTVDLTSG
jgi:peptidoglycan/LPS O-acetylase OafA/YrhL